MDYGLPFHIRRKGIKRAFLFVKGEREGHSQESSEKEEMEKRRERYTTSIKNREIVFVCFGFRPRFTASMIEYLVVFEQFVDFYFTYV